MFFSLHNVKPNKTGFNDLLGTCSVSPSTVLSVMGKCQGEEAGRSFMKQLGGLCLLSLSSFSNIHSCWQRAGTAPACLASCSARQAQSLLFPTPLIVSCPSACRISFLNANKGSLCGSDFDFCFWKGVKHRGFDTFTELAEKKAPLCFVCLLKYPHAELSTASLGSVPVSSGRLSASGFCYWDLLLCGER